MTKKEMILDVLREDKKKDTKWISCVIGDIAHIGQHRDNGHPYFTHAKIYSITIHKITFV